MSRPRRRPTTPSRKRRRQRRLRGRVDGRRRLVQQDQRRVQTSARASASSAVCPAERRIPRPAAHARQERLVAVRQRRHEALGASQAAPRRSAISRETAGSNRRDILQHGPVEQQRRLRHHAEQASPLGRCSSRGFWPSTATRPSHGSYRPPSSESALLLPAPVRPTSATCSPG